MSAGWREPTGCWHQRDAPTYKRALVYCSPQFTSPDRVMADCRAIFEYQVIAGDTRGYVVRVGGNGSDWSFFSRRHAMREAIDKSAQFYEAAQAATAAWPAELARRAELQKQAEAEAARQKYLAEQREITEAAFAAFKTKLADLTDKTVQQIKAGTERSVERWIEAARQLESANLTQDQRDQAIATMQAKVQGVLTDRERDAEAERERRQWAIESEQRRVEACLREADEARREKRLSGPIPLTTTPAGIVFGTRVKDGVDFVVLLRQMQHMLVSGVSGAGKTTFLFQILHQLVGSAEVERLILIDLKGGVSFYRYRNSPKVEVYFEMTDVVRVIDELIPVMAERQRIMRESGVEHYRGGRIFVVIDEYAEIQTEMDSADTREAKATAKRLAANLASMARRARALGIVLICALQRPTVDAMDAAVRNNLGCRICLRMATNQLAASMLDDLDRLAHNPTTLPNGRLYYYDASRGLTRYLQAQIAPGVDLGDIS